jgi:hypothetical protein
LIHIQVLAHPLIDKEPLLKLHAHDQLASVTLMSDSQLSLKHQLIVMENLDSEAEDGSVMNYKLAIAYSLVAGPANFDKGVEAFDRALQLEQSERKMYGPESFTNSSFRARAHEM